MIALVVSCSSAPAQSTQGFITGRIDDRSAGRPLAGATVLFCRIGDAGAIVQRGSAVSNAQGIYVLPFLTAGNYRLRAQTEPAAAEPRPGECFPRTSSETSKGQNYQGQEKHDLVLRVAARMEVDFDLRPASDIWDLRSERSFRTPRGAIVRYFAADVTKMNSIGVSTEPAGQQTTGATLSYVLDPQAVEALPFAGHDVFAALVMQPGVTADNATARGLGVSVNGQRVSSSNYLLDGLEYNNSLVTGPVSSMIPESVQEYRVSVNNFSAEYGSTSGFVANAVTRSGGAQFHGRVHTTVGNAALNANLFDRKVAGLDRGAQDELRAGYLFGGPLLSGAMHVFSSYEHVGTHSEGVPNEANLLLPERFAQRNCTGTSAPLESTLLQMFPLSRPDATTIAAGTSCPGGLGVQPTASGTETLSDFFLERVDYDVSTRSRLMARAVATRSSRPDFAVSPFQGFNSTFSQPSIDIAAAYTSSWPTRQLSNDFRFGWRGLQLGWDRAIPAGAGNPQTNPYLSVAGQMPYFSNANFQLPGSPLAYQFDYRDRSWRVNDSAIWSFRKHLITFGGSLIYRNSDYSLPYLRDGITITGATFPLPDGHYQTGNITLVSVSRQQLQARNLLAEDLQARITTQSGFTQPDYSAHYSSPQVSAFIQDQWRLARRFAVSLGVRYEAFGAPRQGGQSAGTLIPGQGSDLQTQLRNARMSWDPAQRRDLGTSFDWAGRIGLSYDWSGNGSLVLRTAYGIFYDRLFDNMVQTGRNNYSTIALLGSVPSSIDNVLQTGGLTVGLNSVRPLYLDPQLRTPRVQTWFGGFEKRLGDRLSLEVSQTGSLGRGLVTSDIVNRDFAGTGQILYRSNSGASDYLGLGTVARYRSKRAAFQIAYTYSHSIDNQSEPMLGDLLDVSAQLAGLRAQVGPNPPSGPTFFRLFMQTNYAVPLKNGGASRLSLFTEELNPQIDRGNSDFDQRHNLLFYSVWELPGAGLPGWKGHVAGGWQFSQLAGFRSGFPFTPTIDYLRASLCDSAACGDYPTYAPNQSLVLPSRQRIPGSNRVEYLDTSAFVPSRFLNPSPVLGPVPTGATNELPNIGRNTLIGPGFWNFDLSVSKTVSVSRLSERSRLEFRVDFFNVFNHANLGNPAVERSRPDWGEASYGRTGFESTFPGIVPLAETPRKIQLLLRLHF